MFAWREQTSNVFKNRKEEIQKSPKTFPSTFFCLYLHHQSPKLNLKSNTTLNFRKRGRGGGLRTSFIDWTNNVNVKVKPMITCNKIH